MAKICIPPPKQFGYTTQITTQILWATWRKEQQQMEQKAKDEKQAGEQQEDIKQIEKWKKEGRQISKSTNY